jgi:hypothetical protein
MPGELVKVSNLLISCCCNISGAAIPFPWILFVYWIGLQVKAVKRLPITFDTF